MRTTDVGYLVPPVVATDAEEFTALAAAAHEAGQAGRSQEREDLCRQALALWAGPTAYDGVPDEIVLAERTRLDELRRRVRADLATGLLESPVTGAAEESFTLARELWEANPLDEGAASLAMRAAYRLHRQAEALEIFDALRRTLRDELGVDPGPAVREVHARVLAHDATLGGAEPPPTGMTRRGLPAPTSPSIGRDEEVATVIRAIEGGRRLVTVVGPGGVGKSRLLADVGAALAERGEVAYVCFSGLDDLDTADQVAGRLAVASAVPLQREDDVGALIAALRAAELTIVIDEAEWLLAPVAELAGALLAGCPGLRLLVSSRVPLAVVGERVVALDPLEVADGDGPLDDIRAAPAVRLLAQRLADGGGPHPDELSAWSEDGLRLLARIAERVDGLPLALEIVAGAAGTAPVEELVDLVQRPLDLTAADVDRDARQRTLRETISWSLDRLPHQARVALRRLSIFSGPFSAAAARVVCGFDPDDVDRQLRALTRDRLVTMERTSTATSFRLLRTVRDLAREGLVTAGELDVTRARHRRWHVALWRDAPLSDELIEDVSRTYDDHLDALRSALEVGNDAAAADIAIALVRLWMFTEMPAPGIRWTETLLARPRITGRQRARLEVAHGALTQAPSWTAADIERLAAELVDDADWSFMLFLLTALHGYVRGDLAAAHRQLDRAFAVAEAGARHHLPEAVATRAVLVATDGDAARAVTLAHEALARIGPHGAAIHLTVVIPKVALALIEAGQPDEAWELLNRAALEAAERIALPPTATTAINAGWAALGVDEWEAAFTWFARGAVGVQAVAIPAAIGEAACGAGAALVALDHPSAPELLSLGEWLVRSDGQELPPTLADAVAKAVASVGTTPPPEDWTPDLAMARVVQLVREAAPVVSAITPAVSGTTR